MSDQEYQAASNVTRAVIKGRLTRRILAPVMITAVGLGWLLTAHDVIPGVQWAWVLGLAALGAFVLFLEGVNKFSFVVGPSLIVAAGLSILRQTEIISVDTEVPVLTITVGSLWSLIYLLPLPHPSWFAGE
ncbi:MAG TPA: hypothetical protein VEI07_09040 [Planctomycetaceae bacterium]|nr:hypothetical protein [Planctomycetaceae bacterium]